MGLDVHLLQTQISSLAQAATFESQMNYHSEFETCLNSIYEFRPYLKKNTVGRRYKDQILNSV